MSSRHYATLNSDNGTCNSDNGTWQIHYREAGQGTAVLLLHPSPLSSTFMEPLLSLFGNRARVIAWDTPGYGQSDPLPEACEDLSGYVQALHDFIQFLGLEKPVIYGSATGAQIAIEFGKAYPQMTRGLILENAAWFYDDEREQLMKQYFPDLSPRRDGSHLTQVWQIANNLYHYFPWYDTSDAALINSDEVPLEVMQQTAMGYLIAGPDYHRAYRAAFMNERAEQLAPLTVPTRLVRWSGSVLKKYSDRLDNADLPDNIAMRFAGEGREARFEQLTHVLDELL